MEKTIETSSDRPAILVMPFANQSGKKENDYIGNGMTRIAGRSEEVSIVFPFF